MVNKCNIEEIKKAIEVVGGPTNLAKLIGVSYHTVLTWKSGRTSISPFNCINIEKATDGKVKAKDILPDFPWEGMG